MTVKLFGIEFADNQPTDKCICGGYVAWQEYVDHWEGSCYGICGGYPTRAKGETDA